MDVSKPGIGIALLLVAISAATAWSLLKDDNSAERADRRPVPVVVTSVTQATAETRFEGIGRIAARDEVVVTAEAAGRVDEIAVSDGARVAEGDLLFALEMRDEAANVDAAEANAAKARSEYERDKTLLSKGHVAQERVDQSRAAYDAAAADLAAARVALDDRRIQAPFAGRVNFTPLSPGDYVRPGDPLMTLVTDQHLEIEADIPVDIAAGLDRRAPMIVQAEGRAAIEIEVVGREPNADPATNLITVKALLRPDDTDGLSPGQTTPIALVTGRRDDALFVPAEAVLLEGPRHYVFRVDQDDIARRVAVDIGQRGRDRVEIRDGLKAGDKIVIQGLQKIDDGQAVTPSSGENGGEERQ